MQIGKLSMIIGLINCRFTNNYAIGYAGAIQTDGTTQPLNISQSIFEDNVAEYAGAIALIDNPNVKIEKTNFINNNVEIFGAGIWAENSKLTINDCNFSKNSAEYAGAIALTNNNNVEIKDSFFFKKYC